MCAGNAQRKSCRPHLERHQSRQIKLCRKFFQDDTWQIGGDDSDKDLNFIPLTKKSQKQTIDREDDETFPIVHQATEDEPHIQSN